MASSVPLTLLQGNDTVVDVIIDSTTDDLTTFDDLVVMIKQSACIADDDPSATELTYTGGDITLPVPPTPTQIVAAVTIPAAVLAEPYDRWWRFDVVFPAARRTAVYGSVEVIAV